MNTELKNAVKVTDSKAQYDTSAKRLLGQKSILAHILVKTVEFYKSLGFEVIMQSYNEKAGEKVAFLQIKNYCIETFENGKAEMSDGAYQHVALDVEDRCV